jgi:hypothetical protein
MLTSLWITPRIRRSMSITNVTRLVLGGPSGSRRTRAAGPPPRPSPEPVRVERRVSCRGALVVARQRIHLSIVHAGVTVTVESADRTFRVYAGEELLGDCRLTARRSKGPCAIVVGMPPETLYHRWLGWHAPAMRRAWSAFGTEWHADRAVQASRPVHKVPRDRAPWSRFAITAMVADAAIRPRRAPCTMPSTQRCPPTPAMVSRVT